MGKSGSGSKERANSAAVVLDPGGQSPVLLICDHASNWIPDEFANLGVAPKLLNAHVAWDEGAETVTRTWSRILGAKAVMGVVSRLLIDLNRQPERPDVIPAVSHGVNVPGNQCLTREERESRFERFYHPYHDMVDQLVTDDVEVLMTVHTFSQAVDPFTRDFEIGCAVPLREHSNRSPMSGAFHGVLELNGDEPGLRLAELREDIVRHWLTLGRKSRIEDFDSDIQKLFLGNFIGCLNEFNAAGGSLRLSGAGGHQQQKIRGRPQRSESGGGSSDLFHFWSF